MEAQSSPPLIDIRLGNQVCRRCIILLMGTLLGDGKSHDMSCGHVGAYTKTLCLSRAVFTPLDVASETNNNFNWIKSNVVEVVACASLFNPMGGPAPPAPIAVDETLEWKQCLRELRTKGLRTKNISTAKR